MIAAEAGNRGSSLQLVAKMPAREESLGRAQLLELLQALYVYRLNLFLILNHGLFVYFVIFQLLYLQESLVYSF